MNYIKLNELAAQVMGWRKAGHALSGPYWEGKGEIIERRNWSPSTKYDDAEKLLERVLAGRVYETRKTGHGYDVITMPINEFDFNYPKALKFETLPLAMTVCALRASGIPESSITEAQED